MSQTSGRATMNGKPFEQWTKEEVQEWLKNGDYEEHASLIPLNGRQLARRTKEDFIATLGHMVGSSLFDDIRDLKATQPEHFAEARPGTPPQHQQPIGPSPGARKFLNLVSRAPRLPKFALETSAHASSSDLIWSTSQPVTEASYHVPLKHLLLEQCVEFARQGGLYLIHGHFRSSKTTHLVAVNRRLTLLQPEVPYVPLRFCLSEKVTRMDEKEFWAYISSRLNSSAKWLGSFSDEEGFVDAIHRIHQQKHGAKVVLLADEFQTLLYCHNAVRQAFLEAIRRLANEPAGTDTEGFLLHAMLGFGTYNTLQLTKQAERGDRVVSPFNINQAVAIPQPNRELCMKPLRKYARHALSRQVQIEDTIFDDILSRTRRHLGLLSRCGQELSMLERQVTSQITLADWLKRAVELPIQLLDHGEYSRPLIHLTQNEELRSFTISLLQRDDPFLLDSSDLVNARGQLDQLIDLGLLERPGADNWVEWTAPIIRDMVLQHVYPKKDLARSSSSILSDGCLRVEVLLEQALPLLDQELLCSHYVRNRSSCPSEYVLQAELYSVLRELVGSTSYRVFPEAKDRKKLGRRRIDLLLVNSTRIVMEIKVNLTTAQDLNKAARQVLDYGRALGAQQTILLNFVPADASLPSTAASLFPKSGEVTTFHVLFADGFADLTMLLAPALGEHEPQHKIVHESQQPT